MKRIICLLAALMLVLCGCSQNNWGEEAVFSKNENGNLVSDSGTEYTYLTNEMYVYCLGEREFVGGVQGEEKTSQHMGLSYQTGMFAVKDAENDNILVRYLPNNEWCAIYRKASLPTFDLSVDNCVRLELVLGSGNPEEDGIHTTCSEGISDKSEILAFLSDVRMQESPSEAGLYDMITKPDGMLENCYLYAVIYGFFEEEPNLAIPMEIFSYNDLAYSVSIEGEEYVLPSEWLQKLEN